MTMYVPFPKMLYHASEAPCIVQNQTELDALGHDWHDTPDQQTWPAAVVAPYDTGGAATYVSPEDSYVLSIPSFTMPSPPPQDYGHSALPEVDDFPSGDTYLMPDAPGTEPPKPKGDKK